MAWTVRILAACLATSACSQAHGAEADRTLEELIVTAEKREQRLEDVPSAITVFNGARRDLVGIDSLLDMTNFTPGLQYTPSNDRVSVRGVGRFLNVLSAEGAVATYHDGIYETFAGPAGLSTLFLDRVEILRGPQGTLYGRNAIGGAINAISRRPTADWYAEARAAYANYDHLRLEAAISGPSFLPDVQFRLAGTWEKQTEGWVDNVIPGKPDLGGVVDQYYVEGQLQTTLADGRLDVWLKLGVAGSHNKGGGAGAGTTWYPGPYTLSELGGVVLNAGYGCSGNVTDVVNPSPTGCENAAARDPRKVARLIADVVRLPRFTTFASHWTWHARGVDIRYVTGGTDYRYRLTGPVDEPIVSYRLQPSGLLINRNENFDYREENSFWSHELNLVSTREGKLQWVAGAYVFRQHYRQPVFVTNPDQPEWNGPFQFLPDVYCARTGGVCAAASGFRRYDDRPDLHARSWAVFAQADWNLAPGWTATLGLRRTDDRKHGVEAVRVLCFGDPGCYGGVTGEFFPSVFGGAQMPAVDITQFAVPTPSGTPQEPFPRGVVSQTTFDRATGFASRRYDASWSGTSGTAGLQWSPDELTLAYVKYSRGYRSGGLNVGITTTLAAFPWTDKETADAYEAGVKLTLGRTLQANLALFDNHYRDLQVPLLTTTSTRGLGPLAPVFANIPRAVSRGVEAEITFHPTEALQVLVSYGYLDAHFVEGQAIDINDPSALQPDATPVITAAQCAAAAMDPDRSKRCAPEAFTAGQPGGGWFLPQDLAGNRLPNAPRHKVAVNLNYTWRAPLGDVVGSLSYLWRDSQYGRNFTRPYNRAPAWDQVDARVTWAARDSRTRVILWVKNLFDDLGYDAGASGVRLVGYSIDPRTGAQVPVNQGVHTTFSVTPPRTFGVELQRTLF